MNADHSQDHRFGPLSERATEIQSPEGLDASVDLSIPKHVVQHPDAPQVAGYVLAELLGEGAYGQVWRAWQIRTRKEVAVKVFKHRSGLDWILLQREVERLMRLDRHPHVVTLLDAGLDSDPPFYVIDLLEGGSLQQYVDPASAMPPDRVISWALEICDALSYVHRKGIIHCDLKPANILVDDEGRVRVVDFGQSRVFSESSAGLGTLFFMAPEQATLAELGKPVQPDVRWDIYAIGGTLYAIITGRVPLGSADNTRLLEMAASLGDRLDRYRNMVQAGQIDPRDPVLIERAGPELAAVIAKCLANRPEDRYESVAELRADLLALQAGRPVSPLADRHGYRLRKFIRRNPFGVGLAVAVCVLALAGVLVRTLSIRIDERKAQDILTTFVGDAAAALRQVESATPRVKRFLSQNAADDVVSPAFTRRVMGARSSLWANVDAFWESIDGGPLWRHGEWIELADVARVDPAFVVQQLSQVAASGSDRQKYVAFCLIGQIARKDAATADLCVKAAAEESHPGVVAAARWAAARLGRDIPSKGKAFAVDDISGLTFVRIPGCESFRRGSPPDEPDRYDTENMAASGRPIQTFLLSTTEVPAGAFATFVNAPETISWLTSLATRHPDQRESLMLFGQALQKQLDGDGREEAVAWTSLQIARQYTRWLTEKGTASTPRRSYRLPSEDEWEYACRAGNPGPFCFGDNARYAGFFARCDGAVEGGPVVASRMPSFFGVFDMHGNVWEWTDSPFPAELVAEKALTDEQKKNLYVLRGGAYYSPAVRCRSAQRNYSDRDAPGRYFGLRIVMEERQQ